MQDVQGVVNGWDLRDGVPHPHSSDGERMGSERWPTSLQLAVLSIVCFASFQLHIDVTVLIVV